VTGENATLSFGGATFVRRSLDVPGGDLSILRTGRGETTLVLCHGLTDSAWCLRALAAALAGRFDIVMLDARGHGRSARIATGAEVDLGQDLGLAMDALDLERVVLVGHSVGARGALDFAAAQPDRVSKLVLEDPPLSPPLDAASASARRDRFRHDLEALRDLADEDILERGRAAGPTWAEHEFAPWLEAKRQVDPNAMPRFATAWEQSIDAVTAPVLLLHGSVDRGSLINDDLVRDLTAHGGRLSAVQIGGAGHNVRRENPAEYLDALSAFLDA